jgi:hypothetical protein
MIKTAYFDRNVFDHIRRRHGVTNIDLRVLKAVVGSGELSILLSISLIEETLVLLRSMPDVAKEEWQLLASLTSGSKVVKPHQELLRDDIRAYAKGGPTHEPFTTEFGDLIKYLAPTKQTWPVALPSLLRSKGQRRMRRRRCRRLVSMTWRTSVRCQKAAARTLKVIITSMLWESRLISLTRPACAPNARRGAFRASYRFGGYRCASADTCLWLTPRRDRVRRLVRATGMICSTRCSLPRRMFL